MWNRFRSSQSFSFNLQKEKQTTHNLIHVHTSKKTTEPKSGEGLWSGSGRGNVSLNVKLWHTAGQETFSNLRWRTDYLLLAQPAMTQFHAHTHQEAAVMISHMHAFTRRVQIFSRIKVMAQMHSNVFACGHVCTCVRPYVHICSCVRFRVRLNYSHFSLIRTD